MSTNFKSLFRPEAILPKVRHFTIPPHADRQKIAKWATVFDKSISKLKETEVRDEFLYDIFRDALAIRDLAIHPARVAYDCQWLSKVTAAVDSTEIGSTKRQPWP